MNSCIDKILSIIMDNGCMIFALFLYNILILIILELLGNKKYTNFNNDRINFIANFKHKRRNLYQNFKFKIDCIAYPFIMIIFIGSLFVWGLVEYMSFRYDIIRDVIKERDECYNAILLHFDNKNKVGKSLIEIIEEKGFEENFYPLTTEYIELFCKISSKDNVDKKLILDIYEKYKNEKIEFWYYNILSKWKYLFNDKIEEYNGTIYYNKELKNIYDKE